MKHIQIIMPEVKECSAQSCGFNKNSGCHARAITIGDNEVPGCDTFSPSQIHPVMPNPQDALPASEPARLPTANSTMTMNAWQMK